MALINCYECGKEISDTAEACPHCGAPKKTRAAAPTPPQTRKPKSLIWVLLAFIAVIGCYAALLIPAFAGKEIDTNSLSSSVLWSGIFLALVWRYRNKNGWVGFGLGLVLGIVVIFIAGFISGYVRAGSNTEIASSEIRDTINTLIDSSTDSEGNTKRIEMPINPVIKAKGKMGEVERFWKDYINQIASLKNDQLLELDTIGWYSILDANRINNDKSFSESKIIIQKANEIMDKYQEKINAFPNNTRQSIRSLKISESYKKKMQLAVDQEMEATMNVVETLWLLNKDIVKECEKIINLLAERKGNWYVEGEQLYFDNDNDIDRYNSYLESLENIDSQQRKIIQKNRQNIRADLDRTSGKSKTEVTTQSREK